MDQEPTDVEALWPLLTNQGKLERDRGLAKLEELLTLDKNGSLKTTLVNKLMIITPGLANLSWETKLGYLQSGTVVMASADTDSLKDFGIKLMDQSLLLLTDDEVRVRQASGELLGQLCKTFGTEVFELARQRVIDLIKVNLERSNEGVDASSRIMKGSEAIFHDTAGWRNLETSMKALEHMVEGCGDSFRPFLDQNLLHLIMKSLTHTNRFVRETGYFTLNSFIRSGAVSSGSGRNTSFSSQFAQKIANGLADNWSQVRLAASMTCRSFFEHINNEVERQEHFPILLPAMCLNRYYMAEGVKIYNQETWKRVVGDQGRDLVAKYIEDIIKYYVTCTRADNHAVREAGCHCIAELALKIDKEALIRHVDTLLETLISCFEDESWPVRDTACVASGNFVKAFPEASRSKLDILYPLFVANLKDPISSVRQGAALALSNAVSAFPELFDKTLQLIRDGLKGLKDQPAESERYSDLSSSPGTFSVVKRLRDNDVDLHENQQMYSCGSLAPKMGRGGGCSDAKFKKPSEPWELTDGCIHLYAELCGQKELIRNLHPLLPLVATACNDRHYNAHFAFLETVLKRMPKIATDLDKKCFKPYLEEFMEPLFYACECEVPLARAAGENLVKFLSDYLGPNIFRGRVEKFHPRYLSIVDAVLEGGGVGYEPMMVDEARGSMAIPMSGTRGTENASLGGTPT